jgi:hypothetical protein
VLLLLQSQGLLLLLLMLWLRFWLLRLLLMMMMWLRYWLLRRLLLVVGRLGSHGAQDTRATKFNSLKNQGLKITADCGPSLRLAG